MARPVVGVAEGSATGGLAGGGAASAGGGGEGRPHTRPVARDVPSAGLGHAWIGEGMGRVERFSSSGNLFCVIGNEMK